MAIHARKLALEPDLQILRRHRRPLLRRLEQAHRSALADHVARTTRLGPWVLITESWYKWPLGREGAPLGQRTGSPLFVDLASDEMALLIEMVLDLSMN